MSAFLAIESIRTSPVNFSPSGDDYLLLFERVERQARGAAHARARKLAASQHVGPIQSDKLEGFGADDEPADDFLTWLETIRKEDQHGSVPE
jgi:hypothetical protein